MIRLQFTEQQIEELETERYTHPHPKVQRKMEALYLKSMGLDHQLICRIGRITEPTLVRYLRTYEQDGTEGLKRLEYRGQPSQLGKHTESLEAHFRQHPPATSTQAQATIQTLTQVRRSPTQVRAFLHRLGMKYRKTGFIPGPADDPEKQAEQAAFVKKTSSPNWRKPRRASGWFFS
jgi:transposase